MLKKLFASLLLTMLAANMAWAKVDLKLVESPKVCMVTDMVFPRDQILVVQNGKTYYGCCDDCKNTLAKNPQARTAIDPISKKNVDKAKATIGALPNGRVIYFENKKNFQKFIEQN